LIGRVEVVQILHSESTWSNNTCDWRMHALPNAFELVIGGSGRNLKGICIE
jgi:hypothetical protein